MTLLLLAGAGALHAGAENSARKKARYYFSAGIEKQAESKEAEAYEYFKKAYQEDPTYVEGAAAYGGRRIYVYNDTLQSDRELDRSLEMVRGYIDRYPGDLFENLFYGYTADQLGHADESLRVLERTYSLHPESSTLLYHISEVYAGKGDWRKSIEALDRFEKQQGHSTALTTRKVSYMLVDGDTLGAIREMREITAANPKDVPFTILQGNLYDIVNLPDSALACFLKAESYDKESGMAKLALASHYLQRGDSAAYDTKMYEVMLTDDLDFDQKVELVAEYLQHLINDNLDRSRGDYLFSVLEGQYPHEPQVLDLAARYSAAKADLDAACEQISYAIDLDPSNVTYWGQLMTYQTSNARPEEALETYERAKAHIIPDRTLKLYYVQVAETAKRYDLGAEMLRSMIAEIQPDLAVDSLLTLKDLRKDITADQLDELSSLLTMLGDNYHLGGENGKAYRMYENALAFDDSNAVAKNNYAYFLCEDGGDLDKALELSRSSLTGFDATNPTYLDTYAWICFLKGNIGEALEYQQKAMDELEQEGGFISADVYTHYGDILAANGDWNRAVEAWKEGLLVREYNLEKGRPEYNELLEKIKDGEPRMTPEAPEKEETPDAEGAGKGSGNPTVIIP